MYMYDLPVTHTDIQTDPPASEDHHEDGVTLLKMLDFLGLVMKISVDLM